MSKVLYEKKKARFFSSWISRVVREINSVTNSCCRCSSKNSDWFSKIDLYPSGHCQLVKARTVKFSFTESSANYVDAIQAVQAKPSGRPKRQGLTSQFHSSLGVRRTVWSSTAVVVAETSDCCADTGRRLSRLSLDLCIPMRSHSAPTCAICRWSSMKRSRSAASHHQHLHGASQTRCNACGSSISISCFSAVTACWLSTRSTIRMSSHKNSLQQVLHWKSNMPQSVVECEHLVLGRAARSCRLSRNFPRERKTHCQTSGHQLQMQPTHAAGCASIAVSIGICGESKLQIVTASGENVPTNSRVALRCAINLTSAASSGTGSSRPH